MGAAEPIASSPPSRPPDAVDYELLFDCVHCGLCLEACPTYVLTRSEMDSPRGRIYLMKALAQGELELDSAATRHLDLCLACRACETACPSGVRYGRLIEKARAYVEDNRRRSVGERIRRQVAAAIFPYPARLRRLLAPLRLIEGLGLRPALASALPRALREWLELLPPLSGHETECAVAEGSNPGGPRVAVHQGCVAQVLARSEILSSERLLTLAGYHLLPLRSAPCCGALDLHAGNRARALEFARANVRALADREPDAIISTASGCSLVMAEYGELLANESGLAEAAKRVSASVKDLSSLLLKRPLRFEREVNCTVTYHDACHLAHGMAVRQAPRRLLRSIPGVRLVELNESDMCCGSAGSYNLTEPEMARRLAQRKADNIIATGADYVVVANTGCKFQIAAELRRRKAKTKAIHLADFVALAM